MNTRDFWVEALQTFLFAAIFFVTGPSLAAFLFRKTHCRAAALLISIGTISAALGLILLGLRALNDHRDGMTPYNSAALVCQLGGAAIMAGGLLFTNIYTKKLISSRALDPSLRSSPLGLRYRR